MKNQNLPFIVLEKGHLSACDYATGERIPHFTGLARDYGADTRGPPECHAVCNTASRFALLTQIWTTGGYISCKELPVSKKYRVFLSAPAPRNGLISYQVTLWRL
ncbi:MAG: hypothetical protein ACYCSH_13760 [Acidithiobacillus sp.]